MTSTAVVLRRVVRASLFIWLWGEAVISCGVHTSAAGNPPKALFIGNSFVYYGGCVKYGNQGGLDDGIFDSLCRSAGVPMQVFDCTYGGHDLNDFTQEGCRNTGRHKDGPYGGCKGQGNDLLEGLDLGTFDYVFISEAGKDNECFLEDFRALKERFPNPKTRFFYLSHPYTYFNGHRMIIDKLPCLEEGGVTIVEWGKLVYDLACGNVSIPGTSLRYDKNTFIKNKGDDYHANPLCGYITAQMALCAATGLPATEGDYSFCNGIINFGDFIAKHYNSPSDTDFDAVFASPADMAGIQALMEKYIHRKQVK